MVVYILAERGPGKKKRETGCGRKEEGESKRNDTTRELNPGIHIVMEGSPLHSLGSKWPCESTNSGGSWLFGASVAATSYSRIEHCEFSREYTFTKFAFNYVVREHDAALM